MRELREDNFSENKNDDIHEHVKRVLDIVSLFNIPGVSHNAFMLRVFPITLTGAAKRWVHRLPPGTIDSCDLFKKAFIQRYCPPSKTAKQLKEIRNFKQEGDETLYQAWERYNDLLYKCSTHDINSHQKSMFEHLKLAQLKKTDMLVETADMTKRSPIGIVENALVKIDKFLFSSDFMVMDMLNTRNETMFLGRPFLATIHAEVDVYNKEISLAIA
nr:hypothetical protein [Tanacetum cinerariifolium]